MPVVQLSRIKHRRGADENIDKVLLQEGEIGFTTDTGRIFMGGPNVDPTKPRKNKSPHNIEVLTELTPVSELTKYNYLYRNTEHPEFPTELSTQADTDYMQFLQEKLDESVSVKSYGAVGNFDPKTGLGKDDTVAIRKAAVDVTSRDVIQKRALYFPAGIYKLSRPAIVPPMSTWIGDGIGKTVIWVDDPNTYCALRTVLPMTLNDVTEWDHEVVVNNGNGYDVPELLQMFNNIKASPDTVKYLNFYGITFVYTGPDFYSQEPQEDLAVVKMEHASDVNFWNCSFESNWKCATEADLEQYFIGATPTNPTRRQYWGGITPNTGVELFRPWIRMDNVLVEYSGWDSGTTPFIGSKEHNKLTADEKYLPRRDTLAVLIDSFATGETSRSENIYFYGCEFKHCTYGLHITDNVHNVTVVSSMFKELYKGVSLGDNPSEFNSELKPIELDRLSPDYNEGPKQVRVTHSRFDKISDSGFFVARNETEDHGEQIYYGHSSSYNTYDVVGHTTCDPNADPAVPAIVFQTGVAGCTSMSDNFHYQGDQPELRVLYDLNDMNIIINAYDGSFIPGSSQFPGAGSQVNTSEGLTVQNNRTEWTNFIPPIEFNTGVANSIILEYSVKRGDDRFRVGVFNIVTTGHEDGTNWTEQYVETAPDPGIVPDPYGTGVIFRLQYDATGNTIKVQYRSTDLPTPGTGIFKYTARYWDGDAS